MRLYAHARRTLQPRVETFIHQRHQIGNGLVAIAQQAQDLVLALAAVTAVVGALSLAAAVQGWAIWSTR